MPKVAQTENPTTKSPTPKQEPKTKGTPKAEKNPAKSPPKTKAEKPAKQETPVTKAQQTPSLGNLAACTAETFGQFNRNVGDRLVRAKLALETYGPLLANELSHLCGVGQGLNEPRGGWAGLFHTTQADSEGLTPAGIVCIHTPYKGRRLFCLPSQVKAARKQLADYMEGKAKAVTEAKTKAKADKAEAKPAETK